LDATTVAVMGDDASICPTATFMNNAKHLAYKEDVYVNHSWRDLSLNQSKMVSFVAQH
jgi:hypothetical protein